MRIFKKIKNYKAKASKFFFAWTRYPKYIKKLKIQDNLIMIEADGGNKFDGNCYYIAKELGQNGKYANFKVSISVRQRLVRSTTQKIAEFNTNGNLSVITLRDRNYYKTLASAKYFFTDTSMHPHFIKKDGQIIINLWHGTPLKTLGIDDKETFYRNGNTFKSFIVSDFVLAPSKFVEQTLITSMQIDNIWSGTILYGGYPRNTALFNTDSSAKLRNDLGLAGKKVYVYMPTYRGNYSQRTSSTTGIEIPFYLLKLDEILSDNEVVYVKLHPYDSARVNFKAYQHIKPYPNSYETYQFLNIADVLITDYSSVMFDFACTGRKIILFTYDKEKYLSSRGMYLDINKDIPFPKVDTVDALYHEMTTPKTYSDKKFLSTYCKLEGISSTNKILDEILMNANCLDKRNVYSNKKNNVVIYAGNLAKNGITSSLIALLNNIDIHKNNYLVVYRTNAVSRQNAYDFKTSIPQHVKLVGVFGKMDVTLLGKILLHANYLRAHFTVLYMKYMSRYYKLSIKRMFGNLQFSTAIQFNGYEWKQQLQYSCFDANRIIFVHSNMVGEAKLRKNQNLGILKYCYSHYDHVVAVASLLKESIHQISPVVQDLAVIPNIVDTDRVLNLSKLPLLYDDYTVSNMDLDNVKNILCDNNKIISTIGRFSPEKAHIRLIEQFGKVWESTEDNQSLYLMIIGGPGPKKNSTYKDELEFIENKPYKDNVILIQSVSNPYNFLKHSMGFILPSLYEGQGIVLMEADILGIPVVATETDGTSDLLGKYHGKIVSNDDNGVLNALKLLLNHKIKPINIDYKKYNSKSIKTFEKLVN